ncbi:LCP family protein [Sporosarcina thermotolerans]|uniref:LCP family protein n=1 Tax=Sporosarcina thermotolerans TaxID=633404 RepID=UPI0024BC5CA2|nr:LCP family protein [Sporosarcina thermotolerans]WHT48238.1 LCP family protein [Sporosarcina thermotolerans]
MKRGLKILIIFSLVFLAIIASGALYWHVQYKSGLAVATEDFAQIELLVPQTTFKPFEGVKSEDDDVLNILLVGSDARDNEVGRSDALMILHYNQSKNDLKLVSIMRDTYVDIPEHGKQKINAAFAFGGPELVRETLKQNFDIDIQYYATVNLSGFSKIMDVVAPDGIEIDVSQSIPYRGAKFNLVNNFYMGMSY